MSSGAGASTPGSMSGENFRQERLRHNTASSRPAAKTAAGRWTGIVTCLAVGNKTPILHRNDGATNVDTAYVHLPDCLDVSRSEC